LMSFQLLSLVALLSDAEKSLVVVVVAAVQFTTQK